MTSVKEQAVHMKLFCQCHTSRGNISVTRKTVLAPVLVCVCVHLCLAMFPHGPGTGDLEITSERSPLIPLRPGFPFYGMNLSSIVIYRDAFVCFDNSTRDFYMLEKGALVGFPAIAIWASEVRTSSNRGTGSVTYRLTTDGSLLRQISETSRNFSNVSEKFYPAYALVVTWADVGTVHYNELYRKRTNTFQAVLASDGRESLFWVEYPKIQWIYDGTGAFYDYGGSMETVDFVRAQVGFYKGDGTTKYLLPVSFTPAVRDLAAETNVFTSGVYIFRVDTVPVNATMHKPTTAPTSFKEQSSARQTITSSARQTITSSAHIPDATATSGSIPGATEDTVSAPIAVMAIVCVVIATTTTIIVIIMCRPRTRHRHKRRRSRKVAPEERQKVTTNRRIPLPLPATDAGSKRGNQHSARSVVSNSGICIIEY